MKCEHPSIDIITGACGRCGRVLLASELPGAPKDGTLAMNADAYRRALEDALAEVQRLKALAEGWYHEGSGPPTAGETGHLIGSLSCVGIDIGATLETYGGAS